jgi:hypothetical protein
MRTRFELFLFCVLLGCAARNARPPNAPRSLEEPYALAVIGRAYEEEGQKTAPGRDIKLPSGKSIHVDVGTAGRKYGVAYLSETEVGTLDERSDLPPHMSGGDLAIVQGSGPDEGAVILVIFAADYTYAPHDRATAAEKKLTRDVRDFLIQARSRKLR